MITDYTMGPTRRRRWNYAVLVSLVEPYAEKRWEEEEREAREREREEEREREREGERERKREKESFAFPISFPISFSTSSLMRFPSLSSLDLL